MRLSKKKVVDFIKNEPLASLIIVLTALSFYLTPLSFLFEQETISPLYNRGLLLGYNIAVVTVVLFAGFWYTIYPRIIVPFINKETLSQLDKYFGRDKAVLWARDKRRHAVMETLVKNANGHISATDLEKASMRIEKMSHAHFHYYILKELRNSGLIKQTKARAPYYVTGDVQQVHDIISKISAPKA